MEYRFGKPKEGDAMKKRMKWALLVAALFAAVAFTGCKGDDGKIYGSIWWPSGYGMITSQLDTTGGFPSTVTKSVEYQVDEGSYYFYYYLYDLYTDYSYSWYEVTYSVSVNEGKFLKDGEDKHFTINCYYNGADVTGTNIVATSKSVIPEVGETIKTYSNGDYTITLKYKKMNGAPSGKIKKLKG
jgi:hypothetical protein